MNHSKIQMMGSSSRTMSTLLDEYHSTEFAFYGSTDPEKKATAKRKMDELKREIQDTHEALMY